MDYYLYKLKFTTPVHFGSDRPGIGLEKVEPQCHADTFFSALCTEAVCLGGENFLEQIVSVAKAGKFLISDLFPYDKENLFIPKPSFPLPKADDRKPTGDKNDKTSDDKKIKKLTHIPVTKWVDYINFIFKKGDFPASVLSASPSWILHVVPRVAISRDDEENNPYMVGTYTFDKGAGLYFIVGIEDISLKQKLEIILKSLGYSGIGGKRSTGYGKFELADDPLELDYKNYADDNDKNLALLLNSKYSDYYMTLSLVSPKAEEIREDMLKKSFYTLIPRTGFVASPAYNNTPLKRKPLVMFDTGSCFKERIEGNIPDVSDHGGHPVYRYGKSMMIGVKL